MCSYLLQIKPVQIEIYYEALCSDSVNFVKDQLIPVYRKFNKFIDVTFNPFSQGTVSYYYKNKLNNRVFIFKNLMKFIFLDYR
jgi:hypothetical protein